MTEPIRKLAAIVFTDIVGYTKLTAKDQSKASALLKQQRELFRPIVESYKGMWVKEIGDGLLLIFDTVTDAVNCCIKLQEASKQIDDLDLRIGIHQGEILIEENDIIGDDVNVAARIEPFSASGGIAITNKVHDAIIRESEFETKYLGKPKLKGVEQKVEVYCITSHGLPETILSDVAAKFEPEGFQWNVKNTIVIAASVIGLFLIINFMFLRIGGLKQSSEELNWARQDAIPRLYQLIQDGKRADAYKLGKEIEFIIPEDSMLVRAFAKISRKVSIFSEPKGAEIYRKDYNSDDSTFEYLGLTPVKDIRFPWVYSLLKLEKDGFETIKIGTHPYDLKTGENKFLIPPAGTIPTGMVLIPGGATSLNMPGLDHLDKIDLPSCFMDIYEVTNTEYKKFIDDGGYQNKEYWPNDFNYNGENLSFKDAINKFVDGTNIPGPSTWEAGYYPDGQADYPVSGISWFEANAYAKYVNKSLPSLYHWNRAADTRSSDAIIPKSNFNGKNTLAVGSAGGVSSFGNYDMAGNVREWCENKSSENTRVILGGGFDDLTYMFTDFYAQGPWMRGSTNGFRCMKEIGVSNQIAYKEISLPFRDYYTEEPVTDETYNFFLNQFDYDKTPLEAKIIDIDDSYPYAISEKIVFKAAYDNEEIMAFLFTPKNGKPPYKAIVYFPGSNAIHDNNSTVISPKQFDYFLKSNYAVIHPIYKGTYERGTELTSDYQNETVLYKDHVIWWGKDLKRSIDYLESREDINSSQLAYYGVSWGGGMGALMIPIEKRFKVGLLYVAGLMFQKALPEVDQINYVTRINIPTIMMNGKYDHFFPLETSQQPMYDLMSTPIEDKKHYVFETGHYVPRKELAKEMLGWLEKYLQ